MKRKMSLLLSIIVLITLTSACASKLTTIRPTLIDRIVITNCETEETAEILRNTRDELDWKMDDIVFQMEQMYDEKGKCADTDEHLYAIELFMNDKLELSAYINSDGSVCKKDSRYVQVNKDGNTHSVIPADYEAIFELD